MRLYWSLDQVPELRHLTKAERRKLMHVHYLKAYRQRQTWFGIAMVAVFAVIGSLIGGRFGSALGRDIGWGIGFAVGYLFILWPIYVRYLIQAAGDDEHGRNEPTP